MHSRRRPPFAATLTLVLATVTPAVGPAARAQEPRPAAPELAGGGGNATLPYAELRALWLAAQAPKPPPVPPPLAPPVPPVAFNVGAARVALEVAADGRSVRGRATFEVQTFLEGWTVVPLLPATGTRLTGVEPTGALVAVRDDALALLVNKPDRQTVTLLFTAPLAEGGKLTLVPGTAAPVNELTVGNVPPDTVAEVAGATRDEATGAFHLATGQPLVLTLVRTEDRRSAPPPAPSVWRVAAEALVRYDDGRLVYWTRLRAAADDGSGRALELALPNAAEVLRVDGADLDRWRTEKTPDGRRLLVSWKTPDLLRRELFVDYELPQPSPEGDWPLHTPRPVAPPDGAPPAAPSLPSPEGAPPATFTLAVPEGVEFPGATPGDPRTAPRWLLAALENHPFVTLPVAAVVAGQGTGTPVARARRLPLVPTAPATVEDAGFKTRLVADGATLTEARFAVRHDGPLPFTVALPDGATLLACAVDDRETAPVDRGDHRLEFPLPAGAGKGTVTRVTFSYSGRTAAPLAPVAGQISLALPQTGLFTETLRWDLQIPDAYELTALDGNVELTPAPKDAAADAGIHLRKDLLKGERPAAELFYQKKAVTP